MKWKTAIWAAMFLGALTTAASAQTWNGQTLLMKERSPSGCSTTVAQIKFTVEGNILKIGGTRLIDLQVPIGPDGTVKQDVRLGTGARGSLVGRVATREFTYTSYNTGCQYNWAEVK